MAYTPILTNFGITAYATAFSGGTTVNVSTMVFGDGNGIEPIPNAGQVALVHQTYSILLHSVSLNGNIVTFQAIVPANSGARTIREVGLNDDLGNLIAVSAYPTTVIPATLNKALIVNFMVTISNAQNVVMNAVSEVTLLSLVGAVGNISSPLMDIPLKNSLAMKSGVGNVSHTCATTTTLKDRYGTLVSKTIDTPRFNEDGYFIEGGSTNLIIYSEQFDNATWSKTRASIISNTTETIDPYGTNMADKLIEDATVNSTHVINPVTQTLPSNTIYTASCYIKAGTRSKGNIKLVIGTYLIQVGATFDLISGTITSATQLLGSGSTNMMSSIIAVANGWFRLSISALLDTVSTSFSMQLGLDNGISSVYTGDGSSGLYIFGAQLEALPYSSSYIPTTSSAVTRTASLCNITAPENIPNLNNDFTLSFKLKINGAGAASSQRHLSVQANNLPYFFCQYDSSQQRQNIYLTPDGVTLYQLPQLGTTSHLIGSTHKYIVKRKSNFLYLYCDGILVNSVAITVTLPTTYSVLKMNGQGSDTTTTGTGFMNISNLKWYDFALSDNEIALA